MRPGTRRGQPGRPPRRRRAISIGTGMFLIAAGAILLFAVTAGTSPLNWHIVGVILILAGVAGLLLPPVVQVWPTPGPPPPDELSPDDLPPDDLPLDEPPLDEPPLDELALVDLAPDEPPDRLPPDELRPEQLTLDELASGEPPRSRIWPSLRRKSLAEIRRESAEDVAAMRDDGTHISPDAPAHQEDDL
jgi:hypothetical protein